MLLVVCVIVEGAKPLKIQEVQDNKTIPTLMYFVYKMSENLPEERSKIGIYWHNNNIYSDRKQQCKVLSFQGINWHKNVRNQENNPILVLVTLRLANDIGYCQG